MKCKCCDSSDIVRATVIKTGKMIAVCRECDFIYDLDEQLNPIIEGGSKDPEYLKQLHSSFKMWNELTDIVPYDNA